jgi:alanine dehydrogenase
MLIGVPKECKDGEFRVGMTPQGVATLVQAGHKILVQHDAGTRLGLHDADFESAGAGIVAHSREVYTAEMIVKVKELQPQEFALLQPSQIIFAYLHIAPDPVLAQAMLDANVIGIAYETVRDDTGKLPLLAPMSMIAGRLSISVGAWGLQLNNGGKGTLLSGGPGVPPGRVLVLGAGNAGSHATDVAVGLGAEVMVLDIDNARLQALKKIHGERINIGEATSGNIADALRDTDLVVGAILNPGKLAPKIISRSMLRNMEPGSVLIDICIDQGGLSETSRPTSHSAPFYIEENVVHYCVGNMPSAVARSATLALANATLPYISQIADRGVGQACGADRGLAAGVQIYRGLLSHPDIARDLHLPHTPIDSLLGRSIPC